VRRPTKPLLRELSAALREFHADDRIENGEVGPFFSRLRRNGSAADDARGAQFHSWQILLI
jgi:hypothetical protein